MARLGIDFGTTNTVAVASDGGRFPVVLHSIPTRAGEVVEEVFPSAIWIDRSRREWLFGLEAERRARRTLSQEGSAYITSMKRDLRYFAEGQTLDVGLGTPVLVEELFVRFLEALKRSILRSRLAAEGEKIECVISWPANSNGAQRHITRRAFREAGFDVIGSLSEPAASAVEYADRAVGGNRSLARSFQGDLAVFDIGGGTFDAALVRIEGNELHVLDSAGIERLGGDDFDRILLEMFLLPIGIEPAGLDPIRRAALLHHARREKEGISRNPEKDWLELRPGDYGLPSSGGHGGTVRVPVREYYERLRPKVAEAVKEMERILRGAPARSRGLGPETIDAVYLVGGSSRLPLISEMVKDRFPKTPIVLSEKPFTSVAMGAAIVASEQVRVSDIIARHFGVIRLRDEGRNEFFSPIFRSGTRLPRRGEPPLVIEVAYSPRHNIGHLRYLECQRLGTNGLPEGEMKRWSDILFPYDPSIPPERPLAPAQIQETDRLSGTRGVERYLCDSDGIITVKLERAADGRNRIFEISKEGPNEAQPRSV